MVKLGEVTGFEIDDRARVVRVDVALGIERNLTGIPFQSPMGGMWVVPNIGDRVEVYDAPGGPAARFPSEPTEFSIPSDLSEGDAIFKFNEGTSIRFRRNNDDTYNVEINADGDVLIDGIDFDQHVHDFEDSTINDTSDGSGSESTETKQTGAPK